MPYGEIEVGLHRSHPEAYDVELRVTDPGTAGEVAPARGQARISHEDLSELQYRAADYGQRLSDQLFNDREIREFYLKNQSAFDSRGLMLRLRILIGPSAPELHGLRWELLCDPATRLPLATSERIVFSRFMLSRDWRVVNLRPKVAWKALVAVAAPVDLARYGMPPVDLAGEVDRARHGLAGIDVSVLGQDQPVTLDALLDGMRQGMNLIYLVCHGAMPKGREPCLFLQDRQGATARALASALAQRIGELPEAPLLVVLASCESAGCSQPDVAAAHSALAPLLAEAGVPAVLAMQGKISMETVKEAMPVFFRELLKDGQIDRAMAVARGVVRERHDSWVPALFLRLKSGCLWNGLEPVPRPAGPSAGSAISSPRFASTVLAALEQNLVQWLGPIAGSVVRKESLRAAGMAELCRALSEQIPEVNRPVFLRACRKEFGPEAGRESGAGTPSGSAPVPAGGTEFDPAFLENATIQLAGYIGPLARVKVERTAKKAASIEEFTTLLSNEIASASDRQRFVASLRGKSYSPYSRD